MTVLCYIPASVIKFFNGKKENFKIKKKLIKMKCRSELNTECNVCDHKWDND